MSSNESLQVVGPSIQFGKRGPVFDGEPSTDHFSAFDPDGVTLRRIQAHEATNPDDVVVLKQLTGLLPVGEYAQTLFVDPNGDPSASGENPASPTTLEVAVTTANLNLLPSTAIVLGAGTYTLTSSPLTITGKNVSMASRALGTAAIVGDITFAPTDVSTVHLTGIEFQTVLVAAGVTLTWAVECTFGLFQVQGTTVTENVIFEHCVLGEFGTAGQLFGGGNLYFRTSTLDSMNLAHVLSSVSRLWCDSTEVTTALNQFAGGELAQFDSVDSKFGEVTIQSQGSFACRLVQTVVESTFDVVDVNPGIFSFIDSELPLFLPAAVGSYSYTSTVVAHNVEAQPGTPFYNPGANANISKIPRFSGANISMRRRILSPHVVVVNSTFGGVLRTRPAATLAVTTDLSAGRARSSRGVGGVTMTTAAGASPTGSFNNLAFTGNKALFGVTGFDGVPLVDLVSLSFDWTNLRGPGGPNYAPAPTPITSLTPCVGLLVDFNYGGSPDIRSLIITVDQLSSTVNNKVGTYSSGSTMTYSWTSAMNAILVGAAPAPGGTPVDPSTPGPLWQDRTYKWSDLVAYNPSACLVDAYTGEDTMPVGMTIPAITLMSGDEANIVDSGKKILTLVINDEDYI